jgi:hypothetical protein
LCKSPAATLYAALAAIGHPSAVGVVLIDSGPAYELWANGKVIGELRKADIAARDRVARLGPTMTTVGPPAPQG